MGHNGSSLHEFLVVLALVMFFISGGGFAYPMAPAPGGGWRWGYAGIAWGLFLWLLSTFIA